MNHLNFMPVTNVHTSDSTKDCAAAALSSADVHGICAIEPAILHGGTKRFILCTERPEKSETVCSLLRLLSHDSTAVRVHAIPSKALCPTNSN